MKEKNWQDFFDNHSDYRVETYFYEARDSFTLEELYQAFKTRLADETHAASGVAQESQK